MPLCPPALQYWTEGNISALQVDLLAAWLWGTVTLSWACPISALGAYRALPDDRAHGHANIVGHQGCRGTRGLEGTLVSMSRSVAAGERDMPACRTR
jgi:hypothetical protein